MEKIGYEEIGELLRQISPGMDVWVPTDREYLTVSRDELEHLIQLFPGRPYRKGVNECEEIARRFTVQVRDWELDSIELGLRPEVPPLNRAFGEVHGERFRGEDKEHTVNVVVLDGKRIYLVDRQAGVYWPAVIGRDVFYFGEM